MDKLIVLSIDGLNQFYLDDTSIHMPVLRAIAQSGGRVSTLETCYPSVTWAAHTSVITGCDPKQNGVYGNTVYDKKSRRSYSYFDPTLAGADKLIFHKTIFDALHEKGYTVASICWPMTQGLDSIKYNIPEFYQNEYFEKYATKDLWQNLLQKGVPVGEYAKWSSNHSLGHLQDKLTTQIACQIMQDTEVDVIFMHYLITDSYLHDFGIGSAEVSWACEYVDMLLGELLEKADAIWKNYNIMVFTDHGQSDIKQYFHANAVLRRAGLYCPQELGTSKVVSVSNGGSSFLYELNGDGNIAAALEAIGCYDVVEEIWDKEEMLRRGYICFDNEFDFLPDAIVGYRDGVCCSNTDCEGGVFSKPTRYKSTHGFSSSHQNMNGFMVVRGDQFKKGVCMEKGTLKDIAPTIAKMFSLNFSAQGIVLQDLLNG